MKPQALYLALFLLGLPVAAASAAGPSGQALAFTCAGCHGTDGSSVGPSSPSIAQLDPDAFIDAMHDYRADRRNATIMNRIARAYSDGQIEAMAAFFYRQKLRPQAQEHDPALAGLGRELHDRYCEKCHINGGEPSDAGILAGQWMPYLAFTLEDFRLGKREWPRKMQRKVDAAVAAQGDQALPALIHYYGSQH
jgi:sulfide dehydrogenase cytochrome subunit